MSDSTPQAVPPPQVFAGLVREIAARIEEQRQRYRRVALGTGMALAATALCGWLTLETTTDFLTNLPWIGRLVFLIVGVGGAAGLLWWFGLRPWRRGLDDETIALMIERARPEFRSRFIGAVQLAKSPEAVTSPSLVKALVAETTAMSATMDFSSVVDAARMRSSARFAILAVLLTMLLAIAGGHRTLPLIQRALLGTNPVPRKTLLLQIDAPRLLAVGEDWRIAVTAGGTVPEQGRLRIKTASGRRQVFELLPDGAPPAFARGLQSVQESFAAVVELGDAESESIAVRVQPRPAVAGVECRQNFPAYTKLPAQRRAIGDLKILAGSTLALKVRTNFAVKVGEIRLLGPERDKVVKTAPLAPDGKDSRTLIGAIEIPAQGVGGMTINLIDTEGIESRNAAIYPIEVVLDQPPTIKLLWPDRREELLTREATMLLAFEARDDFGIAKVRLHYAVDWVDGAPHKTIELDAGSTSPRELVRRFNWRIGQITPHVEVGSVIDYWLEVRDANDVSGPGIAFLEHFQGRIVSEAEKRADLANRLNDTMTGLNGVREGQEEINRRLGEIIFAKPPDQP